MFDIITIGTATRDVFLHSGLFKIVRDPEHLEKLGFPTGEAQCFALGGKLEIEKPVFAFGGGATNAATTFARQKFKTATLVKIGRDTNGQTVLENLKKEKVSALPVVSKNLDTAFSTILVSPNAERTVLVYRGAADLDKTDKIPFAKLKARWAYIVPGTAPLEIMSRIVDVFKKNGAHVAINPSKHYLKMGATKLNPLLGKMDVVILNREEGAYLAGLKYEEEEKIFQKFDRMVPGLAIMTDGPKGVSVSDGKTIYHAGVFKEKSIASRLGAGDAFGSGFVAGLMISDKQHATRDMAIKYAVRLGSANATSVVEHVGAQTGILTKKEFSAPRWRNLPISTHKI